MKKWLSLLLLSAVAILLAACNTDKEEETNDAGAEDSTNEKLEVYTTVYPLQYFAERIGGDYVHAQTVYPPGANEHTFEPTQKDMMAVADADFFFYVGQGLEGFVENAKKTLEGQHVKMVATADVLTEEQFNLSTGHVHAEGDDHDHSATEEEHNHEHDATEEEHNHEHDATEEEHNHEHDATEEEHNHKHDATEEEHNHDHDATEEEHNHDHHIDTHVWLSPILSKDLASVIKDELIAALPEQEELFTKNYDALVADFEQLNKDFEAMATETTSKTFFVSHAAFGYIAGHYGFNQVPVAGINSQDEPSQKELANLVELAKKENIQYIFFEQNVSSKLTEVIQKEVGAKSLILHNLGVLTQEDIDNGEDYFTLMRKNIEQLQTALSQ